MSETPNAADGAHVNPVPDDDEAPAPAVEAEDLAPAEDDTADAPAPDDADEAPANEGAGAPVDAPTEDDEDAG